MNYWFDLWQKNYFSYCKDMILWMTLYYLYSEFEYNKRNIDTQRKRIDELEKRMYG